MSTIGATMLAAAAGLTFGLFLPSVAHADDPPPSTVPVSERRVDVTVIGLALLVAAACTLFWTKGP